MKKPYIESITQECGEDDDQMKERKAELLSCDLGDSLINTVLAWADLKSHGIRSNDILDQYQAKWEVFQQVLFYLFEKEYQMVLEEDNIHCGVVAEDGEWLFRANLNTFKMEGN